MGILVIRSCDGSISAAGSVLKSDTQPIVLGVCGSAGCVTLPSTLKLLKTQLNGRTLHIFPTQAAQRFLDWEELSKDYDVEIIFDIMTYLREQGLGYSDYCESIKQMCILPITANSMAKLRACIMDNDLLSIAYAHPKPVRVFPCVHPNFAETDEFKDLLSYFELSDKFMVMGPTHGFQLTRSMKSYRYGALPPPHVVAAQIMLDIKQS